jgi:hypothetical protein
MTTDHAPVSFAAGRFDLRIPPRDGAPELAITGAQAGLAPAGGALSLSSEWLVLDARPEAGEDACGRRAGWSASFLCGGGALRVDWGAAVYDRLPAAAVWMSVANLSDVDQHLLRLDALRADPDAGARVQSAVRPGRALLLNNGLWMDTPHDAWRLPLLDGQPREAFWSAGIGEPGGAALAAGIGEPATACASVEVARRGEALALALGGWLWIDPRRRPLRLPPGRSFALQRMLIVSAAGLHEGLVQYAELAARYAQVRLRFPPYAGIFAAYGGDPAGEHPERHPLTEARIETLRAVVDRHLKPYGLDTFKTQFAGLSSGPPGMVGQRSQWTSLDIAPAREGLVERVRESGFTPDAYDSRRDFPSGIAAHVRDLAARGYRPALVCRPFLNIRGGPPEYDQLAADLFGMAVEQWGYRYLMFDFTSDDYESADDTRTMAQGIRSRFQAVRDRVGPDVFIEACMVSPGPVLGIADGFRHACDWRGGVEAQLARQACARYYYHGRWFQLDHEFFDPHLRPFTWVDQGVEGLLAPLDRVKLWVSFGALTGFSWLTGGVIERVSAERWRLFTRALPVHGRCARPLDLLEGDPPGAWRLDAHAAGQPYSAIGLFNWTGAPRAVELSAAELGFGGAGLFFDFWERRLLGPAGRVRAELPPWSCKVLFVQPDADGPVWVGTDRHATGAIGLDAFAFDPGAGVISGACSGPAGTRQRHYARLPEGWAPASAEGASFEVPHSRLLEVRADIGPSGRQAWRVQLQPARKTI